MNNGTQLREMVAAMLMLPPDQLAPETSLASLDTSLGGARLKLGLKRLGLSMPTSSLPATFGELEAALLGKAREKAPTAPSGGEIDTAMMHAQTSLAGVAVGIDVQDVKSLPVTGDYWEHEFYVGIFNKSEIAYTVVQPDPRTHLAGYWCAKEALRKCDPSFMNVPFESTVVSHERDGRPYMQWQTPSGTVRLPHAVSLSHTGELATAVVIAVAFPPEPVPVGGRTPAPAAVESTEPLQHETPRLPAILFGLVALLVLGAIVVLLFHHFSRS